MHQRDHQAAPQHPQSFLARYGLALAATALSALARWLLPGALIPAPYLGFYPAVVASAALGGVGPGLVSTFTSLLLVNFVFGHFNIHDHGAMGRQVIWVVASIGVSLLAGMQRAARMRERRQREWLHVTLASIGDGVIATDDQGRVTFLNPVAEALAGWTLAEALGQPIARVFPIIHEQTRQPTTDIVGQVLREKGVVALANHTALVSRDGREIPIEDSAAPIMDAANTVTGVVLVFHDVTQRRRVQEELRQSEARFRTMADAIPQLAWIAQADGYITWYNRRWFEYTGTTPEQMEGWGWQSVHDPQVLPKVLEQWTSSIANGEPFDMVFPLRGADGRFRPFLTRGMPLKDPQGRVVQWFGTNTDIDEMKRAEEALARLAAIVESSDDAIVGNTLGGIINTWNGGAERIFGYTAGEAIGQPITIIIPDDRKDEELAILERLRHGEHIDHYETVRIARDGRRIDVSLSLAAIKDSTGNIIGVSKILRDITERKRAEEELRKSERRYSALFANKINGMAHCRTLTDEHGRPVDYVVLEINEAYERIIGVKKADIEGRRVTEIFPDIRKYAFDYIGMYGKVALEGGEIKFEEFFEATGQCLSIYAYSPLPGEFIAIFTDVTERKQAEEALRLTQASIDVAVDMIAWFTPDGRVRYANDATCRTLGYSREELLNLTALDFSPGFTWEQYVEHWREMRERKSFTLEVTHRRKDGSEYPAEVLVNHVVYGGKEYLFAYGRDITARKRAEEALRQSEERLRTMADAMPQLAWIAQADGYIFWYNRRWYEYTGTTPGQMEGWGWQSVHDPQTLPAVMERWIASIATGEPFNMVFPLRGADGAFRPFLTRVMPLKDAQGRVTQWFGTNTDVEELKRAEEDLERQREWLNVTLTSIGDGVITCDTMGRVTFINPVAEALSGWNIEEAVGQPIQSVFRIINEKTRQPAEDIVGRVLREKTIVELANHTALVTKDGGEVSIEDSAAPIMDHTGNVGGVVLVFHNVTDQRFAREQLRAANAQLTAADRHKDEFLAMLAHELRNPLSPVRSAVEILRLAGPKDPILMRQREIIDRQIGHMARLLDDLLDVSRVTRGKIELKRQPLHLDDVLVHAAETATPLIESRHHTLTLTLPPDSLRVGF